MQSRHKTGRLRRLRIFAMNICAGRRAGYPFAAADWNSRNLPAMYMQADP